MSASTRHTAGRPLRVERRNATYQHWETLLHNRTKRHRSGEFVVQGVRPITLAIEHGWEVRTLLRPIDAAPSAWAQRIWDDTSGDHVELTPDLLADLADRDEGEAELVAVVAMPPDDLDRVAALQAGAPLVTVFDRPTQPGNIGTLTRSVDAFGGTGLVVTGHAADPYDPKAVRASTGSLLSVPIVRVPSHREVLDWVAEQRAAGAAYVVIGTDEGGETDLDAVDLTGPVVLVIGNETRGLTRAWREECDQIVSIPMVGSASSLNAATAGSIVLHAALAQRRRATG